MAKRQRNKNKCTLPKYEITPVLSLQDVRQNIGWSLQSFNVPNIWKLTAGEGVTIAVLDSGCDLTHEDLKGNLIPGPNLIKPTEQPLDIVGHGTHVSGIIAANNNELGVVGIANKAKILVIKVLNDSGVGDTNSVAKGIKHAINAGVDMMCMSLGSPNDMPNIHKVIGQAYDKGIPIFCAAGNAGQLNRLFYPSNFRETISVASVNENLKRANFSNTNHNINFFAPGTNILSTIPTNWYGNMSGTSQSAPWLCGIAALLLSYKRSHNVDWKLNSVEDYRDILKQHCSPINDNCFQGFGLFRPEHFMEWLEGKGN